MFLVGLGRFTNVFGESEIFRFDSVFVIRDVKNDYVPVWRVQFGACQFDVTQFDVTHFGAIPLWRVPL